MNARLRRGAATALSLHAAATVATPQTPYPILFVTQTPQTDDFTTVASSFGNHLAAPEFAARGGDLYLRYPDGTLRNLTAEAGFGSTGKNGFQDNHAIAVRDPAVSWDGTRAVFSMVVGAPSKRYEQGQWFWQLYEVSRLGRDQSVVITKVPHQPADANNVQPAYLSDGSLVFVSDRPRNGAAHLYPQRDEYEEAPTPTGLWRLDRVSGALSLLEHSPSGSFHPIIDSHGRLLFTRWDHLLRDQQNEDAGNDYGTFNYSGEEADSIPTGDRREVFPEPRTAAPGSGLQGLTMNHFFPWMVNQDGSSEETLNHVGRHELHDYFDRSLSGDPALREFIAATSRRRNPRGIANLFQLREDPRTPGRYVAIDAPEFGTFTSGQIVRFDAGPEVNPADIVIDYLTPRSTARLYSDDADVPAGFSGRFRDPLPLSDGRLLAAHTTQALTAHNEGSRENPLSRHAFHLTLLEPDAQGYLRPGEPLIDGGIGKSLSWWDPDVRVSYSGPLWELSPVEVRPRAVPPRTGFALAAPEQQAFAAERVDVEAFRRYLRANGLGLLVMRNVTSRDGADRQQPYNLRVPGGVRTAADAGKRYDVVHMQFFQGDLLRGIGRQGPGDTPKPGRRVLAQALHDPLAQAVNAPNPDGPAGSTAIAPDGSVAMVVPARRALAWQSTGADGTPVVRERYWIGVQPGEIRACDGCHGVNRENQAGVPAAQNVPAALRTLLARWRDGETDLIFADGNEER